MLDSDYENESVNADGNIELKKDHIRNQIYLKHAMDDADYYHNKHMSYYNALYYERR